LGAHPELIELMPQDNIPIEYLSMRFSIMRKTVYTFLSILIVLGGMAVIATPTSADWCYEGQLDYTNNSGATQTVYVTLYDSTFNKPIGSSIPVATLNAGESFSGKVEAAADEGNPYDFVYSVGALDANQLNKFGASTIEQCNVFNDGRLNYRDAAAPFVVYFVKGEQFELFAVNPDNGVGVRVITIDPTTIRDTFAEATSTGQNLKLIESSGIVVYALSSGNCQANSWLPENKIYEFEWVCNIAPPEEETK
jgi:hypothetical protein